MNLTGRRFKPLLALAVLLAFLVPAQSVQAIDWSLFKDPEDGQLDLSNWLLERGGGFLPVPILITEPALEGGLGAALTFFHKAQGEPLVPGNDAGADRLPPSVSFGAGAYTGNDSWFAGGGHFASWKKDRIRYIGAAGLMSINLEFFVADVPFKYNIDGFFLLQDIQFRIKETPLFLGAKYTLFRVDATFGDSDNLDDPQQPPPGIEPRSADGRDAGLGLVAHYDSRDNIFSPTKGREGFFIYTFFNEAVGGTFNYEKVEAKLFSYHPLGQKFILGVRLDGEVVNDGAPFYGLPYVDLRGVPLGRYQDEFAGVAELEGLWNIVGRWTLVGFGGAGFIDGDLITSTGETILAGGVGFRYLMARRLGLKTGIDLAWSEDGFAFYIGIGTGWR